MSSTKQKISILNAAEIQLRHAIIHCEKGEFIPAITLAGAADELLGKLSFGIHGKDAAEQNALWERKFAALLTGTNDIRVLLSKTPIPSGSILQTPTAKDVRARLNKPRNDLKHNDSKTNHVLEHDFSEAAYELIDSALKNLIMVEGYAAPKDAVVQDYHKNSPRWNGVIPQHNF